MPGIREHAAFQQSITMRAAPFEGTAGQRWRGIDARRPSSGKDGAAGLDARRRGIRFCSHKKKYVRRKNAC